jgi:hypothetical protein
VVTNGVVYLADGASNVTAVDSATGRVMWMHTHVQLCRLRTGTAWLISYSRGRGRSLSDTREHGTDTVRDREALEVQSLVGPSFRKANQGITLLANRTSPNAGGLPATGQLPGDPTCLIASESTGTNVRSDFVPGILKRCQETVTTMERHGLHRQPLSKKYAKVGLGTTPR